MKKIIFILLIMTFTLSAKTITGKLMFAGIEEGEFPMIGINVKGKEYYLGYKGKTNIRTVDKKSGRMIKAYLSKDGEDVIKVKFLK
jgi:uncharacterized ParB-like nuclease family protein